MKRPSDERRLSRSSNRAHTGPSTPRPRRGRVPCSQGAYGMEACVGALFRLSDWPSPRALERLYTVLWYGVYRESTDVHYCTGTRTRISEPSGRLLGRATAATLLLAAEPAGANPQHPHPRVPDKYPSPRLVTASERKHRVHPVRLRQAEARRRLYLAPATVAPAARMSG